MPGTVEGVEIESLPHGDDVAAQQRVGNRVGIPYPVHVATPQSGESGVKCWWHLGDLSHHEVWVQYPGKTPVQIGTRVEAVRQVDVGHLAASVHPGVRAPRHRQRGGVVETQDAGDPGLQLALHGAQVRLACPAREVRSVIGDVQAPASHEADSTVRTRQVKSCTTRPEVTPLFS